MKQADLVKGLVLPNVTGEIECMAVSFDDGGFFECIWGTLKLSGEDMHLLEPKKKFGISGVYPWFKVHQYEFDSKESTTNFNEGEFLIPWSNLKKFIPK